MPAISVTRHTVAAAAAAAANAMMPLYNSAHSLSIAV